MKKFLILLIFAPVTLLSQTMTLGTTSIGSNTSKWGIDADHSYYDENINTVADKMIQSMNPIHYRSVQQAGQYLNGSSGVSGVTTGCWWADYDQYTGYTANEFSANGGYFTQQQGANQALATNTILSNNKAIATSSYGLGRSISTSTYSIDNSNNLTINYSSTTSNAFIVGQGIYLSGFPTSTFLNGNTVTITSISATSFIATGITHSAVALTTESGKAQATYYINSSNNLTLNFSSTLSSAPFTVGQLAYFKGWGTSGANSFLNYLVGTVTASTTTYVTVTGLTHSTQSGYNLTGDSPTAYLNPVQLTLTGGATGTIASATWNLPSTTITGTQAGTYPIFLGGSAGISTSLVTITINSSSQVINVSYPYNTLSYSTGPPSSVTIPSYFWGNGSCTTASGDTIVSDSWPSNGVVPPSAQADIPYMGWALILTNGGTVSGETSDLPSATHYGLQALSLNATANSSSTAGIINYFDTGHQGGPNDNGTNNLIMVGTWTIKYTAKLVSGSGNLSGVFGRSGGTTCSFTQALSTSWATYTTTCAITSDPQTSISNAELAFNTSGQENIEIMDASAINSPDSDPSGLGAKFLTDIAFLGAKDVRFLDGNELSSEMYNTTTGHSDLLNFDRRVAAPLATGQIPSTGSGSVHLPVIQLPQALTFGLEKGISITYPVPMSMTPTEIKCLADFIWGTSSTPGTTGCAAIRLAQPEPQGITGVSGQSWGAAFAAAGLKIHMAYGNENWNSGRGSKLNYLSYFTINGVSIPYAPYAYRAQQFANIFKTEAASLSGYTSGVTMLGFGVQDLYQSISSYTPTPTNCPNGSYMYPLIYGINTSQMTHCSGATASSLNPIISVGGTSSANYGLDFYEQAHYWMYQPSVWSEPTAGLPTSQSQTAHAEAHWQGANLTVSGAISTTNSMDSCTYYGPTTSAGLECDEYESGFGTLISLGSPTQTEMDSISSSLDSGNINAVQYLLLSDIGWSPQHFFTYAQDHQKLGSLIEYIWGIDTSYTSVYRPSGYSMAAINACIPSGATKTAFSWSSMPTFNYSIVSNNVPTGTVPYLTGGYYVSGNNKCIAIVNEDPVNSHTITLSGTGIPSVGTTVTQRTVSSSSMIDTCEAGTCSMYATTTPTLSTTVLTVAPNTTTTFAYSTSTTNPAATPTFSPSPGTYGATQTVTITSTTSGATIYYSTDNVTYFMYTGPLTINTTTTLYTYATASGYTQSLTNMGTYTINGAAATPSFSPVPGTYVNTVTVSISSATPGAVIYYSYNGTSFNVYSAPLTITSTSPLYAYAIASGYGQSATYSGTFTITSTPSGISVQINKGVINGANIQ